jgi:hypothetical protein
MDRARGGGDVPAGMLIEEIDGAPSAVHPIAPLLLEAGFISGALGFQASLRSHQPPMPSRQPIVMNRPSKSTVSSPFASRYFDSTATDEES